MVYQRPKISAKNEGFQPSAFGFSGRIKRLNMAECEISEFFLNGLYAVVAVNLVLSYDKKYPFLLGEGLKLVFPRYRAM